MRINSQPCPVCRRQYFLLLKRKYSKKAIETYGFNRPLERHTCAGLRRFACCGAAALAAIRIRAHAGWLRYAERNAPCGRVHVVVSMRLSAFAMYSYADRRTEGNRKSERKHSGPRGVRGGAPNCFLCFVSFQEKKRKSPVGWTNVSYAERLPAAARRHGITQTWRQLLSRS